jgi:hypothetical protein
MAAAGYVAYVLHLIVVIGLQSGIEGLAVPPLAKFALVTAVGVPLAFSIGHFSRRVPGVGLLLGTRPATRKDNASTRKERRK